MQRHHAPLSLILTASAFAFTSPAHAQSKPYYVGDDGASLRQASERFERYLSPLALQEANGREVDHKDFIHIDKIVFPAGEGMGMKGIGPSETGSCGGGIEDEAKRRLRQRAAELADQPVPVRWKDVKKLQYVIAEAQFRAAMKELEQTGGGSGILPEPTQLAEGGTVSSILPHPTHLAENAFQDMVATALDHADERQARDAQDLVSEFKKTLSGDLERMRNRRGTGLEQTWLLVTEFQMNVERVRARKAIEVGASPEPATQRYAGLFLERQRLAKGVGIAN